MRKGRTEFAAGFFPAGSYFADSLVERSPATSRWDKGIALIVAGGSDGSTNDEYLRSVECNCWIDVGGVLESSTWMDLPDMLHSRGGCTGCVLPDGRFVVMGGRSKKDHCPGHSAGPERRDGEVFDPRHYRWRMLPPLPAVFGESPELTLCAGGPSLLVVAMVKPDNIGGKRCVAALQLATTRPQTELERYFGAITNGGDNQWWRDRVTHAAAEERWVTLGSLPEAGEGPSGAWHGSQATT